MNFEEFISGTDENPRPRKIVLFGGEGTGKTSTAARFPGEKNLILPTEDGYQDLRPAVSRLTFDKKRLLETEGEIYGAIDMALRNDHDFQCVILDSAEAAETAFQKSVATGANKETLADIGFGKGHEKAATKFKMMLDGFDALLNKGMHVIIIAHAEVERFNDPAGDPYDRYTLRLDKRVTPMLKEWADEVLFFNFRSYTKTTEEGFGKKTTKAVGSGERIIFTTERPTHDAKNRIGLPDEIRLEKDCSSFWATYMTAANQFKTF